MRYGSDQSHALKQGSDKSGKIGGIPIVGKSPGSFKPPPQRVLLLDSQGDTLSMDRLTFPPAKAARQAVAGKSISGVTVATTIASTSVATIPLLSRQRFAARGFPPASKSTRQSFPPSFRYPCWSATAGGHKFRWHRSWPFGPQNGRRARVNDIFQ